MSLRERYEAELRRARETETADPAARREGVERLRAFHQQILAEGLPDTSLEIEFDREELLIDPGRIMITVRVTPAGGFRLFYEVKGPQYAQTEVPGIASTEDLEREIARLLVAYR